MVAGGRIVGCGAAVYPNMKIIAVAYVVSPMTDKHAFLRGSEQQGSRPGLAGMAPAFSISCFSPPVAARQFTFLSAFACCDDPLPPADSR